MLREVEHRSHGFIALGAKSSKSCLQGDENKPQSHWDKAKTIVRGEPQGYTHGVPPGLPGLSDHLASSE